MAQKAKPTDSAAMEKVSGIRIAISMTGTACKIIPVQLAKRGQKACCHKDQRRGGCKARIEANSGSKQAQEQGGHGHRGQPGASAGANAGRASR